MKRIKEKAKIYDGNYKAYTELINKLEDVKDAIKKQNYGIAMDILCKPYLEYQITTSDALKEGEDERIRKWCISHFRECFRVTKDNAEYQEYLNNKVIPWLENQGEQKSQAKSAQEIWKDMRLEVYQQASGNRHEPNYSDDSTKMFSLTDIDEIIEKMSGQKPAEWSEEDERMYRGLHNLIYSTPYCDSRKELSDWLKFLKDRVQLQSTWSEEDEKIYQSIMDDTVQENQLNSNQTNWLRDIKYRYFPQPKQEIE